MLTLSKILIINTLRPKENFFFKTKQILHDVFEAFAQKTYGIAREALHSDTQ